ncbi:RNA polymerase sigma factor [Terrimonas pollutisoli]|uniref:RNA polymerase sigma factor n=1 Tax=Terrimonas pollutisoli TaxID=3034147 RepID=UPI0023EBE795|nr:sigma-70 family RNA polymerase sigma factor [Terrimonas sp. H1YJ31]
MLTSSHDMEWSRFKNGDVDALESIYRLHVQSLINYGLKITDDLNLVKDSIQDLFIELWKGRQNLADTDQPKYYLFRALRNKLVKRTARQSFISEEELQLVEGNLQTEYVELTIVYKEQQSQTNGVLKQVLERLSKRQQEAIYLRFYHNFSYETIASMMNMNYQSVLNLVQRALKSMRKEYRSVSSFHI